MKPGTSSSRSKPSTSRSSVASRQSSKRADQTRRAGRSRSTWAIIAGQRRRAMRKRVSSSGTSKAPPLKVTRPLAPASSGSSAASSAGSSSKSRMKCWTTTNRSSSATKPAPTRNAYVPVPPARPVVSASRKSRPRARAGASSARATSSRTADGTSRARASATRPWVWPRGYSCRTTRIGPSGVSWSSPPTSCSMASGAGRGWRLPSILRMIRRRSSSVLARSPTSAGELTEQRGGRCLGATPNLVHGTDARGATPPAWTGFEGLQAAAEQVGQNIEDALGEPDAAGVRIVEIDRRIEALGGHEPLLRRFTRRDNARLGRRRVAEPGAEVADVAEQEDRRQMVQEVRHRAQPVDQLLARRAHAPERLGGHGDPRAGGLHLLLGQLDLARAHVLERAHLDLLEADDLLGHQDLTLLGHVRRLAAIGEPAEDPHALGADGVREVVDVHALDVGHLLLVLAEAQLLHLVGRALDEVDRLRMDRREGAPPVDLGDDLPALRLPLVARGRVDDHEIVGGHRAQRHVIGGIGLRGPVPAAAGAVEQALVLERGQIAAYVEPAEAVVARERQLEHRALQVIGQDERVVGIDPRVLRRHPEEVVGVRDHELVERGAGSDHDRGRGASATARPPRLLPERGDRAGVAGEHRDVEMADVDAELERVGGHDAEHLARAQALLDGSPAGR